MKCCGVVNADDWRNNVTNPGWSPDTKNKPEGCCKWKKDDNVSCYLTELQTKVREESRIMEKAVTGAFS